MICYHQFRNNKYSLLSRAFTNFLTLNLSVSEGLEVRMDILAQREGGLVLQLFHSPHLNINSQHSLQNTSFNSLSENLMWNWKKPPHIQFSYFSSPFYLKVTGYCEKKIHSYTLVDRRVNLCNDKCDWQNQTTVKQVSNVLITNVIKNCYQLIKTMKKFEKETRHWLYVFIKISTVNSAKCETAAHTHDTFCPLT